MKAKLHNIVYGIDGYPIISFKTNEDVRDIYAEWENEVLEVTIKEYKPKRSKDANAYFWELCSKLSAKLQIPKEEIYRNLIKGVGDNMLVGCFKTEEIPKIQKDWQGKGLGWVTEVFESKIKGCTNILLYEGSSAYDTAQMSRLIDLCITECKQQGIETLPPDELKRLVEEWR